MYKMNVYLYIINKTYINMGSRLQILRIRTRETFLERLKITIWYFENNPGKRIRLISNNLPLAEEIANTLGYTLKVQTTETKDNYIIESITKL